MESVKISTKKCKIAMALAGHHSAALRQRPWVRIPLNYRNFFPVDLQLLKLQLRLRRSYLDDVSRPSDTVGGGGGGGGSKFWFRQDFWTFLWQITFAQHPLPLVTEKAATTTCFSICESQSPLAREILLCEQRRTDHWRVPNYNHIF